MRDITAKNGLDEKMVAIIASSCNLVYGAMSPLWGYFYDKFGFKKVMCCVAITMILIGSSYCFIIKIVPLFAFLYYIGCWLGISIYGLLPPFVHKVFGMNIGKKIYGLIYISFSFSGYIGPGIYSITGNIFNLDILDRYKIMFFASAIFDLVAFILIICSKEEKMKYKSNCFTKQKKKPIITE